MSDVFEWKRYWCPRDKTFDLSDRGFLSDPDTTSGKLANADLVEFESLLDTPCLALLGEPGIGKTQDLQRQVLRIQKSILDNGGRLVRVDLRSFGSEDRLVSSLFQSAEFEEWRQGNRVLHLFLDSLDECLLRIDNVAALLADELPKQPVGRLRLRIVCRTAPWPIVLENALTRLFGREQFEAYELVPLRRGDVRLAAEQSGIGDPDGFLDRIESLAVTSLAIKPVTLNFLINTYLRDGDLPTNQVELYEKGCRILCEEPNASRQSSGRIGRLSAEQRLAVASRIAAVTQLTNKYAVWAGSEADRLRDEDVLLGDLVGGNEFAPDEFAVTAESVREALDTGLFSSRGPARIGWAHQTYAEFLAARYCKRRDLPTIQIRNLIFHPAHGGKRLVPQMHEVAAWISVMMPEVLRLVANADPEALLGAAAASLTYEQRKVVVNSFLNQSEGGRPLHVRWGLYWLYHKLEHPSLAAQLRPYLLDQSKFVATRKVAIDMARACSIVELAPELADIGLDTSEHQTLRITAAAVAAHMGQSDVRLRLLPLALGQAGDDPDDEMKGAGLTALWPDLISGTEVFPLLTDPKNPNLAGLYTSFLGQSFVAKMKVTDLPPALEWFSRQHSRTNLLGPIERLMDNIVWFALDNIHHPGVAKGLAVVILSRAVIHDDLISRMESSKLAQKLEGDTECRRRLLEELLPLLASEDKFGLYYATKFASRSDFEWVLGRILSGRHSSSAPFEAKLVVRLIDPGSRDQMSVLWNACRSNMILLAESKELFEPIKLDSDIAQILREQIDAQDKKREPKHLDPTPLERIARDLEKIDNNETGWWLQLTQDLSLEPTSTHFLNDFLLDLTLMPGWKGADTGTKERILNAAYRYISETDPRTDEWFSSSGTPFVAIGGSRALALLSNVAPEKLKPIAREAWRKWVPSLLRYPVVDGKENRLLKTSLLRQAYSFAGGELLERLKQQIDQDSAQHGFLLVESDIEAVIDTRMGEALLDKVGDSSLKGQVVGALLRLLIKHDMPGSRELAESHITATLPTNEPPPSRTVAAICALIAETDDASWPKIWPTILRNDELGKRIIESISYGNPSAPGFAHKLGERELADLYLWMVRNYPYSDHRTLRSGAMGPADTAEMLRDGVLEQLKMRASFVACDALRYVIESLPQYPGLHHQLEEAESLARAATWQPISARLFLTLAFDYRKRLIENGDQLIEVVLESLDRLDAKLHAELTPVKYLWVPSGDGYKPRDEEDLSDYLATYLTEDLQQRAVIVNREVQIRRGTGRGSGQSTDIHVDTVVPDVKADSYERLSTVIEVKGNWHDELLTAMRAQLRDRYLKGTRCLNGIYLVGWFSSPRWDERDYRNGKRPHMTLGEAKGFFSEQATDLSTEGYSIKSYVLNLSLT